MEQSHSHDRARDQASKDSLPDEERADGVIDADDTGIVGAERDAITAEIDRALERPDR